jgi:hypothetical protein
VLDIQRPAELGHVGLFPIRDVERAFRPPMYRHNPKPTTMMPPATSHLRMATTLVLSFAPDLPKDENGIARPV